jgi:hypothetical protein
VLAAGTSSSDAANTAAAPACELLRGLLLGVARNAHTVPADRTSIKQQQPMWQQLAGMLGSADAVADASVQLQQLRSAAAVASLQFVTAESAAADSAGVGHCFIRLLQLPFVDAETAGLGAAVATSSSSKLSDAQLAAIAPVRVAALQHFDAALFAALDQQQQQAAFTAALQTHASDGDAGCRAAARAALERIPVTASMVLQLLQRVGSSGVASKQQQQSRAKRSKRSSSTAGSQSDAMDVDTATTAAGPVLAADLDAAIAALELLQWKDDVADKLQLLLQPLQVLLQLLTPLMGSIAESYTEEDAATSAADETEDAAAAPGAAAVASPSAAGYAAQLALATLEQLAKEDGAPAAAVDPALVLSCAAAAPDGAVRNAALLLLAVLSRQSPEDVLGHVLQVRTYAVVGCSWWCFSVRLLAFAVSVSVQAVVALQHSCRQDCS